MQAVEEQLRDAFGAAAQTITAQELPGLPARAGRFRVLRRGWAPRLRMEALVPAAAAAGVALIAVAATLVVPRLLGGPPPGQAAAAAGGPAFFTGVAEHPSGQFPPATVLRVYSSATGQIAGTLEPPIHGGMFSAVTRLGGSDQTFVAALLTRARGCQSKLYRFSIDAHGRPSQFTPLSLPPLAGQLMEVTSSLNGKVLAYTASGLCGQRGFQEVGVIHLATQQVSTYPFRTDAGSKLVMAGSVSLTADGSTVGFQAGVSGSYGPRDGWVMPTDTPSGPLTSHARKILHVKAGVFRIILTPTGSRAYVETFSPGGHRPALYEYSTASGRRIKSLGSLGPGGRRFTELSIGLDAAGRHLIVYGFRSFFQVEELNLATGHRATVKAAHITSQAIAW
jgi:hypothetical protein